MDQSIKSYNNWTGVSGSDEQFLIIANDTGEILYDLGERVSGWGISQSGNIMLNCQEKLKYVSKDVNNSYNVKQICDRLPYTQIKDFIEIDGKYLVNLSEYDSHYSCLIDDGTVTEMQAQYSFRRMNARDYIIAVNFLESPELIIYRK
jgi:hypothetical protein